MKQPVHVRATTTIARVAPLAVWLATMGLYGVPHPESTNAPLAMTVSNRAIETAPVATPCNPRVVSSDALLMPAILAVEVAIRYTTPLRINQFLSLSNGCDDQSIPVHPPVRSYWS